MKFDPMTGEPIPDEPQEEAWRFDPETGEPLGGGTTGRARRFDPMTGEPIYDDVFDEEPRFDPNTGKPLKKGGAFKKWMVAVPVVVVVAVVAFVTVGRTGLALGKAGTVAMAAARTFQDQSALVEAFEPLSVFSEDQYTVSVDVDIADDYIGSANVSVEYAAKANQKQISGDVYASGLSVDFLVDIDSKEVKAQIPALSSSIFVYNYADKKTGYITEVLSDSEIEAIDRVCETIASTKKQKEQIQEIKKIFTNAGKNLKFESASSEQYRVDGKDRTCKGYTAVIDEDYVDDVIYELEDFIDEYYADLVELYDDEALDDLYDEMESAFEGMPEIEMSFYIYQKELACVKLDVDGEAIEIIFHGGDARMDDVEVVYDDETVLEFTRETSGSEEVYSLLIEGSQYGWLTYDTSTGDFGCTAIAGGSGIQANGNIQSSKNSLTVEVDDIYVDGETLGVSVDFSVSPGADMQKLSGDEIDLGNASLEELEDLEYEFEDIF